MKKSILNIALLSLLAIAAVSCAKETSPYKPAEPVQGEQVYFPNTLSERIVLDKNQNSFDLPIFRNAETLEALDVAIEASGNGVDLFDIPGLVSFQNGEKESKITVSYNPEEIEANVFYDIVIKISDEGITTPYGTSSFAFTVGIELPWIAFDSGIISESPDWWGEEENKTLYYQQISETVRYCRIPECFGYMTIAGGEPYDVQDYTFYWNTKTNQIYIPKQYMGYTNSNGPTFFLDESEFYNWYWEGYGYAAGTDEWFAFCDSFRAKYPTDYYPYYDGNGGFFLADFYSAGEPGTASFLGFYVQAGTPDTFICNSFVRKDFTSSVEYGGMFVDPDGNATPIINFGGTEDVAGLKYIVAGQDIDPLTLLSVILEGEDEDIQDIALVDGKASVQIALEVGTHRIVAVPYGDDGALQPDDAVLCDFYFPGANAEKPEVEANAVLLKPSLVFDEGTMAANEMTDYNTLAYGIIGKDIKSAVTFLNTSELVAYYLTVLTPDDIFAQAGQALSATAISRINSENGYFNAYIGLDPDTEWRWLLKLTNIYGETKLFDLKASTDPAPTPTSTAAKNQSNKLESYYPGLQGVEGISFYDNFSTGSHKVKNNGKRNVEISKLNEKF